MFDRLFALETFGIKLGLENIARLCEGLGHPQRAFAALHVAGTNGKGSVAAMVHAALVAAGMRAARYTSPHLVDITERFVIGRDAVDRETLAAAVDRVLACADRLQADGTLRVTPTFFEVTTAAAFELFRGAGVEAAVVEVGLGGRFDATNVIEPVAGAITSIGMDHQQHLGSTLEQIAFEKAGIIKPGVPCVIGPMPAAARAVIQEIAATRGAPLVDAAATEALRVEMIDGAARLEVTTATRRYGPVSLGLRGAHQVPNALTAIALLEVADAHGLPTTPEAVAAGLTAPDWPARLEMFTLEGGRRVLLDAAHNQDGAAAFADYLRAWHPERPPLVFGVMQDKDVDVMLQTLLPVVSAMLVTAAPSPRAMPAADLGRRAAAVAAETGSAIPITVVEDPEEALRIALDRAPLVCVAGSIFLAGPVRASLMRRAILR